MKHESRASCSLCTGNASLITMPWGARGRPAPCSVNLNPDRAIARRKIRASERVPGRARGIFEIADIGAEAQAETGPDRHQHDIVRRQRGHAEAADNVGRTVDAGEALVDRIGRGQVVDQRHGAGAVAAPVESDRWSLPEDAQVTGILGVEGAFAVSQSGDKGAAAFLAEHVTVL